MFLTVKKRAGHVSFRPLNYFEKSCLNLILDMLVANYLIKNVQHKASRTKKCQWWKVFLINFALFVLTCAFVRNAQEVGGAYAWKEIRTRLCSIFFHTKNRSPQKHISKMPLCTKQN